MIYVFAIIIIGLLGWIALRPVQKAARVGFVVVFAVALAIAGYRAAFLQWQHNTEVRENTYANCMQIPGMDCSDFK